MNDVMVDIETLGTGPTSVVIQIAAVRFDRNTGKTGASCVVYPDSKPQRERGLLVEAGTVAWWKKQKQEVIDEIANGKQDCEEAMQQFAQFITKKDVIWCHANFDTVLLHSLYNAFDIAVPWAYTRVRDLRTLVDLSGIDLRKRAWSKKTHNALDDCLFQIEYAVDAMKIVGGGQNG